MNNSNSHPARWRNIIIFVIAIYAISWAGMLLLDSSATGPGQLVFILSPILVTVALRSFAKDGWKDMGLGFPLPTGLALVPSQRLALHPCWRSSRNHWSDHRHYAA